MLSVIGIVLVVMVTAISCFVAYYGTDVMTKVLSFTLVCSSIVSIGHAANVLMYSNSKDEATIAVTSAVYLALLTLVCVSLYFRKVQKYNRHSTSENKEYTRENKEYIRENRKYYN